MLSLIGCQNANKGKLERKIEKHIENQCSNDICTIDLSDITEFQWDKLYVFNESATLDTIENVIGQNYPFFTDIARRMVFINSNNIIVYHEDVFPLASQFVNGQVLFNLSENVTYRLFSHKVFEVRKYYTEKGYYYVLDQQNDN